jgi:hypothetical protein
MAELSRFESRSASITCTPEKFYTFITDIRKFGRFIPADVIRNWKADENSCSFILGSLGDLRLNISHMEPYNLVRFGGNALNVVDFILSALISEQTGGRGAVSLIMEAQLNPIMKMMASGPIDKFLETLVSEMEKFEHWDDVS